MIYKTLGTGKICRLLSHPTRVYLKLKNFIPAGKWIWIFNVLNIFLLHKIINFLLVHQERKKKFCWMILIIFHAAMLFLIKSLCIFEIKIPETILKSIPKRLSVYFKHVFLIYFLLDVVLIIMIIEIVIPSTIRHHVFAFMNGIIFVYI